MSKPITRITFCSRCMEEGVLPEKQFLSGEICLGCGAKIFAPEPHKMPDLVTRLTRTLAESFMFRLENVDPNSVYCGPTGQLPMVRLLLTSRAQRGFTAIVSFHERPGLEKEHLQKSASWDEHLNGWDMRPPDQVRAVGRYLNKTFSMNWWSAPGPRMTARFQTIEKDESSGQSRNIWIGIELSWEETSERRYLIQYSSVEWEGMHCMHWEYSNGITSSDQPMGAPYMTMEEALQAAQRCVQINQCILDVNIYDAIDKKVVEQMTFNSRGQQLEKTLRVKSA